ncbi:MAG: hypothetical protein JWR74_306 [Polaromonas sp.]|nr:hypothetical protein [Polaromonas sp.]
MSRYGAHMTINKRQGAVFASGMVIGTVTAVVMAAGLLADTPPVSALDGSVKNAAAPQASGQVATCPPEPAAAMAGQADGQFPFQANVSGLTANEIESFIVIGRDAVAAGRLRDAEVAFLMSCHVADKFKGANSLESADAKSQLGGHYARLALGGGAAGRASRPEFLKRAEFLYLDSFNIYASMYGPAHEKSRSAADGLAALRHQPLAQAGAVAETRPVATLAPVVEKPLPPANAPPRKAETAKAALPAPQVQPVQSASLRPEPSFDCSRTRTASEKMVCADAELFQLNHELGRVYARAKNATADRAAFRRQHDLEWSRRESICRDRGCLVRWYAYRRDQLMSEIEGRTQPQSQPQSWRR